MQDGIGDKKQGNLIGILSEDGFQETPRAPRSLAKKPVHF